MGAIYREEVVHALNVKDAWEILMNMEDKYYGRDSYNGSFNQCRLRKCIKKFDRWDEVTANEIKDFMGREEFDNNLSKYEVDYIDCGVEEYFRNKLIKIVNKVPAPKFKDIFTLKWTNSSGDLKEKDFETKSEAELHILDLFNLGCHDISLFKNKKPITDNRLVSYDKETKIFKKKPKDNYKEMHRYIFVGYCPE